MVGIPTTDLLEGQGALLRQAGGAAVRQDHCPGPRLLGQFLQGSFLLGTEGLAIGFQTLQGLEAGVVAAGDVGKAQQGDIQVGNGSGLALSLIHI